MALGYLLVTVEAGKEQAVHEQLTKVPDVVELVPLFGEYDLIAKLETATFDELDEIIVTKIRTIPGVAAVKTLTGNKF